MLTLLRDNRFNGFLRRSRAFVTASLGLPPDKTAKAVETPLAPRTPN
jgi:hypothetical protein